MLYFNIIIVIITGPKRFLGEFLKTVCGIQTPFPLNCNSQATSCSGRY